MFRNVLAAALANLARNRLYAAISIAGLAVAMTVAILTALFARDELTFDRFVPGYRNIFVLVEHFDMMGLRGYSGIVPPEMAVPFRLDFPEARRVVRYGPGTWVLSRGQVEANERLAWVDPDFFVLFPFKTVEGDLQAAMRRSDGAVLSRTMARKYFGADAPIGQTLMLDRKTPFTVMAVIEDLPSNSNFSVAVFLAGKSVVSPFSLREAQHVLLSNHGSFGRTYVELADPHQAEVMNRRMQAFIDQRVFPPNSGPKNAFSKGVALALVPDADFHLIKDIFPEIPSGDLNAICALVLIAALIVLIAGINFVNLMTARAARRAVEVGVRKVAGAGQGALTLQFIGESVLYAAIATMLALTLAELSLPGLNNLLQRRIGLAYWRDPAVLAFVGGLGLLLGVAAGIYPAVILASFRPGEVLKGLQAKVSGSTLVRQGLIALQFAVLIGLIASVAVIGRQTRFAMTDATRMNTEQMLRIRVDCIRLNETHRRAFVDGVAKLPGVAGVACSSGNALGVGDTNGSAFTADGRQLNVGIAPIDFGFFELYGVRPLAGRFPAQAYAGDRTTAEAEVKHGLNLPANSVINAGLAQAMGFSNPVDAVGKTFRMQFAYSPDLYRPVTVIGVAPDIALDLTKGPPKPSIFPAIANFSGVLSVKIKPGRIPETLTAIDRIWKEAGDPKPIQRRFTDEFLNTVYVSVMRQGWLMVGLAMIAIFIGGLGLFGLAAFTAERRTKEIGIRKAMGASSLDIVRLLLWSFTQPVLWANLIAWPVAWWAMTQWLQGFSARIALSPLYFLAAGAAALVIAGLTVSAHAIRVARAKPVGALRYE